MFSYRLDSVELMVNDALTCSQHIDYISRGTVSEF